RCVACLRVVDAHDGAALHAAQCPGDHIERAVARRDGEGGCLYERGIGERAAPRWRCKVDGQDIGISALKDARAWPARILAYIERLAVVRKGQAVDGGETCGPRRVGLPAQVANGRVERATSEARARDAPD